MVAAVLAPPGWSVGLDVGGSKVLGVMIDEHATVRGVTRVPTRRGVDGVLASAEETVQRLCRSVGMSPGDLVGVGVGVPGLVDPVERSISHAVNLGIDGVPVPLGSLLSARLDGVRVDVENDLNAAALGAAQVLGLTQDLAFLALGTGVAAGLLLDGRLRRGSMGGAGEIGHITYIADGPMCPCGQRGCLELYASGSAIDAAWPSRWGRPAPAEVFEAAAAGDHQALVVRDSFVDAVAAAVRFLVLTCDVRHVLLGGGVSDVGAPLADAVGASLRRQAERSDFLASLRIADRVMVVPRGALVAPIGAALAAREPLHALSAGAVSWRS